MPTVQQDGSESGYILEFEFDDVWKDVDTVQGDVIFSLLYFAMVSLQRAW